MSAGDGYRWATPAAPAAIAVLELPVLADLLDRPPPPPGRARLVRIRAGDGGIIDEAVAWRVAEDRLELHLHGGPGPRAAMEGELVARGLEPEPAAADRWGALAAAPAPAARDWLLAHAQERPPFDPVYLRRVPVILISGPSNAGKSTLLNAWCGHQRALVGDVPGTTRDLLAAETLHRGWRLRLIDGAGTRATGDPIEQAGQALVTAMRAHCDLDLQLSPEPGASPAAGRHVTVHGKADSAPTWPQGLAWAAPAFVGEQRSASLLAALGDAVLAAIGLPW